MVSLPDSSTPLGGSSKEEEEGKRLTRKQFFIQQQKKREHMSSIKLMMLTSFNLPYGAICGSMGLFVLPAEALRLWPKSQGPMLGVMLGVVGISQLICPIAGRFSDECTSSLGRRRPFIIGCTISGIIGVLLMWAASALKLGGLYVFLLFMSMISLNTIFSAQCGLVPDLIQPSQQGSASGIVAVHQLTGSITGFLVVLLTRIHDYHLIYMVYAVMVLCTTIISCITAKETLLPKYLSRPLTLSAIASSFTLDCSQGYDFLWVFIGRTFYYIGVSVQAFIFYFLRDQIPSNDGTRPSQSQLQVWIAEIAITAQVVAAAVAYPMGRLSDNAEVGRKKLVYAACTVMAAVYLLFMTAPFRPADSMISPVTVILSCCIIYGVGCGCFLSVDYAIALDTLPSKHQQIKSSDVDDTPLLIDSDDTTASDAERVGSLDTEDAAAKDLGIWGVSAFLGSAIGPLLWGATLQLFGHTSIEEGQEEETYAFGGYASIMIGGCIACILAGICIAFVKGTR